MNKFALANILLLLFLATSCNNDAARRAKVVDQLRNSADLATVEYVLSKIVTAQNENWIANDAFFFAETQASVKAGLDLNEIQENDIHIEGNKISIMLPGIKIVNLSYPAEHFEVIPEYTDNQSFFVWRNISIEQKDNLYRKAEEDIRKAIGELGIVETAEKNTIMLFSKILKAAGFSEIYIHFKPSQPTQTEQGT